MQTYANFRFNSCINLAEKAYKSVNARFIPAIRAAIYHKTSEYP